MNNINDLILDIIKEEKEEEFDLLIKIGVNLNTFFYHDRTKYNTLFLLLNNKKRNNFDKMYNYMKENLSNYEMFLFYDTCFSDQGCFQKKDRYIYNVDENYEKNKNESLKECLFYSLQSWNIDAYNEILNDAFIFLNENPEYSRKGFKEKLETSNLSFKDLEKIEGKYFSSFINKGNITDIIKKFEFDVDKDKDLNIYTPNKYNYCLAVDMFYEVETLDNFIKNKEWVINFYGKTIFNNIINDIRILKINNDILKVIIEDVDLDTCIEDFAELYFEHKNIVYQKEVKNLKEYLSNYIDPNFNPFVNLSPEDSNDILDPNKILKIKEKVSLFENRLIKESLKNNKDLNIPLKRL